MKGIPLWRAVALAAPTLAILVGGCFLMPPEEDDSLGSFCAAVLEGGEEHCVSTNRSPSVAWQQAASEGGMPIQMWAQWPERVELDALIEREDRLNAWFDDTDEVLAYVRDTPRNAESYWASLGGRTLTLLARAVARQQERLAERPVDAIGNFRKAMTEKASAEKSPLVAEMAADKEAMAAPQAVFEQLRGEIAPLQARYADLAVRFAAYRATEAAETSNYGSLAAQASGSTLGTIPEVELSILAAAHEASGAPSELSTEIAGLSAELSRAAASFQEALAPHAEFLATHGAAMPDATSGALRSLNAMLGYIERRVRRSDATATALLRGVDRRRPALLLLSEGRSVREEVARARLGRASATFRAEAEAREQALEAAPEASAVLALPYLAARYDRLKAVSQLRGLCAAASSWREAGCDALRGRFEAAENELRTSLPQRIAAGLATMRARGMAAAQIDAAEGLIGAGDLKAATLAYDAAVRASEGR